MHRPHRFTTPHAARNLPPFSAAGWLVAALSEPVHRRDIWSEPDAPAPAPSSNTRATEVGIRTAPLRNLAGQAARWLAAAIRNQAAYR